MNNSFYSKDELVQIGFSSVGSNVSISRKASIYNAKEISIGNNVRIDDFCILSGRIEIGSYIHISAYCALYGGDAGIGINDYAGLSARTTIYAMTDDFSGDYMVGAMIDDKYRNVIKGPVLLEKYVQLGAGCVVLPNICIKEGSAVGSMSLVNKDLESWSVYAGIPCRYIKERKKNFLDLKDQITKNV